MALVPHVVLAHVLPRVPTLTQDRRRRVEADVAAFLAEQYRAAPGYARLGLAVLALAFRLWLLQRWLPLTSLDRVLAGWQRLPTGYPALFLQTVRSLALLAFYEHPDILAAQGIADEPERSRRRRQWDRGPAHA